MGGPGTAAGTGDELHPLRLSGTGMVEVAPDFAGQADDRFEAVCDELGILLARRVEPVSARVLPFGTEQLAMVQLRDEVGDAATIHAAIAQGPSRAAAVAGAAIDAMTGGHSVLAAALPGAVAEGKVRSAVVFGDGEAPVRWGRADDETRLAALYAVVPHLGSFTATTGTDTYRVLRLPGIGVALVSEGEGAASWVEGWFAALLHATQFSLRTNQPTTTMVATDPAPTTEDVTASHARVLAQLEDECRRILSAAQEQAREIRESAEREAAASRAPRAEDHGAREDREAAVDPDERAAAARRESDGLLASTERARAVLLADAQREADALRREAEQACATLLDETRAECERLRKDAKRDAKRRRKQVKRLRSEAKRLRRDARTPRRARTASRVDERFSVGALHDARRAADDLLHDARRAADDLLHDATRTRERLLDDAVRTSAALLAPSVAAAAAPAPAPVPHPAAEAPPAAAPTPSAADEAQRAATAMLAAAAESVAAMSSLLRRVGTTPWDGGQFGEGDPRSGRYFGD